MTTPARAIDTPDGRFYPWPDAHEPEFLAISVTNALEQGVPKKLEAWTAREVARYAMDNADTWKDLDDKAAFDLIRFAAIRARDYKGLIGDAVHEAIGLYLPDVINGMAEPVVPNVYEIAFPEMGKQTPAGIQGYFNAFLAFRKKWKPLPLYSEVTVFSRKHKYAGSTDEICLFDFQDKRGPVPTIIDYKTAKRVYDDVSLQLVGYAKADFMAFDDERHPLQFPLQPYGEIKDGIVVRLGMDGKYTAIPFTLDKALHKKFCSALDVARRGETIKKSRRKALNSRPRKGD